MVALYERRSFFPCMFLFLLCRSKPTEGYGTSFIMYLEVGSGSEHRLYGSHAVVVVVLGGELFRAQSVGGDNLD